ncbi:MAG: hypothetical protein DYG93_10600 [Leptolyngbya sp. PLA2]|nr:hypothetical protein [Leptolyngbya sp.]MCE7972093.1 hypothetical protein [Leptolyngbya sp. PL-A2]MCQ3941476.1 hypothetical protein [cyanobacterium CYA1]MCZ7634500.1 hypothetical protein [Phycisphaerales bacterium]MDL1905696.1 hypothetical protein [Synechococcales cyanobacterium CNB]GIK20464.1 MAG: hypothetical protein BroJett004_26280 [Planctomycetota bacterium]
MPLQTRTFEPGDRVRVTKEVPRLSGAITTTFEGTVVRAGREKTGSWYAHGEDKKLWLDRLVIRKDDGELVVCNLDRSTRVEVVGPETTA